MISRLLLNLAIGLLLTLCATPAAARNARPANDAIFELFKTHALVGIGEMHGVAEAGVLYRQIIADPRFAQRVGNVVVEFGGARHQATLDRYLVGEAVTDAELRGVWLDTVGFIPAVTNSMYIDFFTQVREVNRKLPPAKRIRVWLGEPPIDWSGIKTRADLQPYIVRRDSHGAGVIQRNILAQKRKALVIYGASHLSQGWEGSVRRIVDRDWPGAFAVVEFYTGHKEEPCTTTFVNRTKLHPGLIVTSSQLRTKDGQCPYSTAADALVYLGPRDSLTGSPIDRSIVDDDDTFAELTRRAAIFDVPAPDREQWRQRTQPQPWSFRRSE